MSTNESRPVHTGSLFEVGDKDLTVVSVDGFRLALRREPLDRSEGGAFKFVAPGSALNEVEKICEDSDEKIDRYGGIFKNRSSLSRYCYEHKESVFAEDFIPQYGFRVDTPEHTYLLRLNPMQGDYNLYVYCYRREALDRHLKNAERGICFVDPQGKTLFRIPDGDSIRVLRPDGTQHDHICRYIDDHRAEIGSGHLYGMVQFAQQMEQTGSTFVPLRSSLPKQCYSLLLDTGNVVIDLAMRQRPPCCICQ